MRTVLRGRSRASAAAADWNGKEAMVWWKEKAGMVLAKVCVLWSGVIVCVDLGSLFVRFL